MTVLERGNAAGLAKCLYSTWTNKGIDVGNENDAMQSLVKEFSKLKTQTATPNGATIVSSYPSSPTCLLLICRKILTGATGSLGAHLLCQLLSYPNISKIYCLTHADSPEDAFNRLKIGRAHV